MTQLIRNGSRAVAITSNDPSGPFSLRVYVNVPRDVEDRHALSLGTITGVTARAANLANAQRKAARMLEQ